jgi:tetratricopeptide (TPR) repeat protein
MNPGAPAARRVAACTAVLKVTNGAAGKAALLWYRTDARLIAGDHDGAIADADQAEALMPGHPDVLNAQCWSRAVANRELERARAACDLSLEMERSAAALDSRGLVGLRQGRWRDAWEDYNSAFSADPSITVSLYGRGLAALALGRTAEGESDIGRASSAAEEFRRLGLTPEIMKSQPRQMPPPRLQARP